MTCYEIITGEMPFGNHDWRDYDIVLRGERPTFLDDSPFDVLQNLVRRCWHQDPEERPSFEEIGVYLRENYNSCSECDSETKEWIGKCLVLICMIVHLCTCVYYMYDHLSSLQLKLLTCYLNVITENSM